MNYRRIFAQLLRRFLLWVADLLTPHEHDYRCWERKSRIFRRLGMDIGNKVAIGRNFDYLEGHEHLIHVADHVTIGHAVRFWNFNHIRIGRFCMLAAGTTLTNGGHDVSNLEPFSGELVIGNGCWVGNGAQIIGPLTIGDNVIIAAGAVVVNDVPAGVVVAGVPARIIRRRELADKQWHLGGEYFSPTSFELLGQDNAGG